jgi:hypothetical protein
MMHTLSATFELPMSPAELVFTALVRGLASAADVFMGFPLLVQMCLAAPAFATTMRLSRLLRRFRGIYRTGPGS